MRNRYRDGNGGNGGTEGQNGPPTIRDIADAAGAHLDQFQRIQVDPASVSVVRYTARRPFLLRSKDTGGDLGPLKPQPQPATPAEGEEATDNGDAAVGGGAGGGAG